MDRAQLLAELAGVRPGPEDMMFIGRWDDGYQWSASSELAVPALATEGGPDAWIFYTGPWPSGRPEELPRFLEELLAEMESMCGGTDRCRWPLDQPYPLGH